MRPEMQVKQYVANVQGKHCRFMVFCTGSAKHYLFQPIDPNGCAATWQVPVLKADLQPRIRSALAHGYGNVDESLTFDQQKALNDR